MLHVSCQRFPSALNTGPLVTPTAVAGDGTGGTISAGSGTALNPGPYGYGWAYSSSGAGFVEVTQNGGSVLNLIVGHNVAVVGTSQGNPITGVLVQNCIINPVDAAGATVNGISLTHTSGCTIQYNMITKATNALLTCIKSIDGDDAGLLVQYNDLSGATTAVQVPQGTVQFNYMHDPGLFQGSHINQVTTNGGFNSAYTAVQQLNVLRNTVLNPQNQTDAVSLFQDFGIQANRLIDGNLVAGGGYTIYGGDGGPGTGVTKSCGTTLNSTTVTDATASANYVGDLITGTGIPAGTTILTATHNVGYTISQQATATATVNLVISSATSSIVITNNRVSMAYFATGGEFGPGVDFNGSTNGAAGTNNVWAGNVYHDTGLAIAHP
jgi:hypothetical protein